MQLSLEKIVAAEPEVKTVFSRTGTAEAAIDPMPANISAVSYTHLDVYKRQGQGRSRARSLRTANMFNKVIALAVRFRWPVVILSALIACYGLFHLTQLPIDAVPDITNRQVQINTCLLYTSRCV